MAYNKRGNITLMMIFFIFFAFFALLMIGIGLYGVNLFHNTINKIDFKLGNVSFNESYTQTIFPIVEQANSKANSMSLLFLLGMVLVMLLIGYHYSENRLWIIFDIFVIIGAFIISIYLSQGFNSFIHSSDQILDIYSNQLQSSSRLMLNLPVIVPIVGILIIILTYGITQKPKDETPDVYGGYYEY